MAIYAAAQHKHSENDTEKGFNIRVGEFKGGLFIRVLLQYCIHSDERFSGSGRIYGQNQ